jgi:hypothetical protein
MLPPSHLFDVLYGRTAVRKIVERSRSRGRHSGTALRLHSQCSFEARHVLPCLVLTGLHC